MWQRRQRQASARPLDVREVSDNRQRIAAVTSQRDTISYDRKHMSEIEEARRRDYSNRHFEKLALEVARNEVRAT